MGKKKGHLVHGWVHGLETEGWMRFPSRVYSSCRQSSLTLERTTMLHRASVHMWWWLSRETQTRPHLCLSQRFHSWILDFVLRILFLQLPVNVVLKITLWGRSFYRSGDRALLVPRSPFLSQFYIRRPFSCSYWGPTPSLLRSKLDSTKFERSLQKPLSI